MREAPHIDDPFTTMIAFSYISVLVRQDKTWYHPRNWAGGTFPFNFLDQVLVPAASWIPSLSLQIALGEVGLALSLFAEGLAALVKFSSKLG